MKNKNRKIQCLLCRHVITSGKICDNCLPFYKRACQKFKEKRNIDIEFKNQLHLAYYLKKRYEKNNLCTYTGLEMKLEDRKKEKQYKKLKIKNPLTKAEKMEFWNLELYKDELAILGFSVDRKVSKFGDKKLPYSKKNIVLCCKSINIMKGQFDPDVFIQACFEVIKNQVVDKTIYGQQVLLMIEGFYKQHKNDKIPSDLHKAIKNIKSINRKTPKPSINRKKTKSTINRKRVKISINMKKARKKNTL
ncbi:hypothetical protein HPK19_07535 [Arthrobacter citreus]|nr:hypothetical protein HPK19_07535 [Arthrobacter citreus]